jgi:RNA polymerase sigma-70 factor, ECF subfamily
MTTDDRELLEHWRSGDTAAGDALLQRHFPSLARLFHSRMPDRAADLIQRTMLACVESRERVPDGVPFRAYLLGIAHRILVAEHRADEVRRRHAPALAELGPGSLASPSQAIALRQRHRELLAALRELPLDLQLPIELHYWEELGLTDVALVLDVPVGTVKSRLRRGREALVAALRESTSPELRSTTMDDLDRWARELRWFLGRTGDEPPR